MKNKIGDIQKPEIIKFLPEKNLKNCLVQVITRAHLYCGYKTDEEDIQYQIKEMSNEIRNNFKSFTLEDVFLAFDYGVKKELGDWITLSPATYYQWLKIWMFSKQRGQPEKKLPQKAELSEAEKEKRMNDYCNRAFIEFKQTGNFNDLGNAVYDWLSQNGIIRLSLDEKNKILKDTKTKLSDGKNTKMKGKNFNEIKEIIKEMEKINKGESELIAIEAKKQALTEFFSDLIEGKKELKTLI